MQAKERPILFSKPMVLATNKDIKTVTRRIVKPQPLADEVIKVLARQNGEPQMWVPYPVNESIPRELAKAITCPYGKVGDLLWVREAWRTTAELDKYNATEIAGLCQEAGYRKPWAPIQYEADQERMDWMNTGTPPHAGSPYPGRYRHARFMPRWASRTLLRVVNVHIERLHDITEDECRAEGCHGGHGSMPGYAYNATPLEHFMHVWTATGGVWTENPWVWRIEFSRLKQ